MKEKYKSKKWGGILLSMVLILSMILTPCAAFADTATVPMYLTVSEEPLVFDVTENIQMTATQGSTTLVFDKPVTVTNNGTKKIQVSSIALNPASGWSVEPSSTTDFTTAAATALSFTCGSHDFANGTYAPSDAIAIGSSKTYTLEGQVSSKANLMPATKVSDLVLTIEKALEIVSWADGTDEQIVAMVEAADAGKINLSDYWNVGDTRTVHLSAMEATGVSESHAEQDVELVLMHAGGYELADGKTCNFVVGQKDCLAEKGHMNSTNTNAGSWDGSARRTWCNSIYKDSYPATLQPIFKQFKTITAETYNGTTLKTSLDYFALPAAKEVFGGDTASSAGSATSHSNLTEFNALFQFDWYKTAGDRFISWWERSPSYSSSYLFCIVDSGRASGGGASGTRGLAPFGCI